MPSARSGAARQLEGNSLCSMGVLEFLGCGCICSDHRSCCVHSLLLKSQPRIPARLHSSWPWVPHPFFQLSALASGLGISAVSGISASAPSKLGRKCIAPKVLPGAGGQPPSLRHRIQLLQMGLWSSQNSFFLPVTLEKS